VRAALAEATAPRFIKLLFSALHNAASVHLRGFMPRRFQAGLNLSSPRRRVRKNRHLSKAVFII